MLILSLLGLLLYLLTRCCDRKQRKPSAQRCQSCSLVIITLMTCAAIGLGKCRFGCIEPIVVICTYIHAKIPPDCLPARMPALTGRPRPEDQMHVPVACLTWQLAKTRAKSRESTVMTTSSPVALLHYVRGCGFGTYLDLWASDRRPSRVKCRAWI